MFLALSDVRRICFYRQNVLPPKISNEMVKEHKNSSIFIVHGDYASPY